MAGYSDATHHRLLAIISGDDVFRVPLANGKAALVDMADRDIVEPLRWTKYGRYALTSDLGPKRVPMHRLLMQPPSTKLVVDHIDGDGLNNQRHNLRIASHSENMRNRIASGGVSRFKGVWLDRRAWRAEIQLNGRKIRLGSYTKEVEAAKAYDRAAIIYHGEFAATNKDLGLF